jgi:hypothetical protein
MRLFIRLFFINGRYLPGADPSTLLRMTDFWDENFSGGLLWPAFAGPPGQRVVRGVPINDGHRSPLQKIK